MLESLLWSRSKGNHRQSRRFRPSVEHLEGRLTPSGDPFMEPPLILSDPVTHKLTTTLTMQVGPAKIGDVEVIDAWTYNGIYPGRH